MPKENKKRGRREEQKKRKLADLNISTYPVQKRQKSEDGDGNGDVEIIVDNHEHQRDALLYAPPANPSEITFYGLLDEEEQEYFKRADSLLELNQFADAEERKLFLANLYREANGKELKIANSQSCSRLMERLVLMSTPSQLKALFQKFSGHFLNLMQHRFASHCCETLFLRCAPIVTQELTATVDEEQRKADAEAIHVSMENLFLYTVNELEGNLGYLMTDHFASHTIRVLLVVLSGKPLQSAATNSMLQSKKKEKIDVNNHATESQEANEGYRTVPDSFYVAVDKMITSITAGLDSTNLRALAMHPTGNPVLQLLLEIECMRFGKQNSNDERSLIRRLLPDDIPEEGTEGASFINGLLYDAVGSRLLEAIIQFSPGKLFKALYRCLLKERLATLARNDIASYVVIRILERLSKEDLEYAMNQLTPQISALIERSRTLVIKTLIERCHVRQLETKSVADAFLKIYGQDEATGLISLLKLDTSPDDGMNQNRKKQLSSEEVGGLHSSLLVQAMLVTPGPLRDFVTSSLLAMKTEDLLAMAKDRTATHVLQGSLTCLDQSSLFRRKMVQRLLGHILGLATHAIASHVVDAIWPATEGLLFLREKIAEEMLANEKEIRDSFFGRAVWRNWMMDLYNRRRREWLSRAKGLTKGSVQEHDVHAEKYKQRSGTKTSIDLARERFAAKRAGNHRARREESHHHPRLVAVDGSNA